MKNTPAHSEDRRSHARLPYQRPVVLETPDGATYEVESQDLSEGGMCVTGDFLLPACSICQVKPARPGPGFSIDATVIRTRDDGGAFHMGLQFEDMTDRDRAALRRAARR